MQRLLPHYTVKVKSSHYDLKDHINLRLELDAEKNSNFLWQDRILLRIFSIPDKLFQDNQKHNLESLILNDTIEDSAFEQNYNIYGYLVCQRLSQEYEVLSTTEEENVHTLLAQ